MATEGNIRIAIDGPAASGKGTVARAVAQALGYRFLDTGAMYRAVALRAQEAGLDWQDAPAVAALASRLRFGFRWEQGQLRVFVDGQDRSEDIRRPEVGMGASAVAVFPEVRRTLVRLQQELARQGRVVMDGRDIGTVVLPDAELKVYLDASLQERAARRWKELQARPGAPSLDEVQQDLARRDAQDSGRQEGPLSIAPDAVVLDTTRLGPEEVLAEVLSLARGRGARFDEPPRTS